MAGDSSLFEQWVQRLKRHGPLSPFGLWLKKNRMTPADAAEELGVARETASRWAFADNPEFPAWPDTQGAVTKFTDGEIVAEHWLAKAALRKKLREAKAGKKGKGR